MKLNNLLLLMLSFGLIASFAGCGGCRDTCKETCMDEKRVSGPLSDCDVDWDDCDMK